MSAVSSTDVNVKIIFHGVSKVRRYFDAQRDLWWDQMVLQDLTFEVRAGDILTILGPSGAGKSTLLRLVNRLEDPSEGEIRVDGRSVCSLDVIELRQRVGMVFQLPAFFPGTVQDNILYGPQLHREQDDLKEIAEASLARVGLSPNLLDRTPETLSVGQQQRVCMARALANEPSILLLDEPSSALDLSATLALEELIRRLGEERKLTVLFVSHDLEQVKRVGHRTLLLIDGRMVELNETEALFHHPRCPLTKKFLAGLWKEERND